MQGEKNRKGAREGKRETYKVGMQKGEEEEKFSSGSVRGRGRGHLLAGIKHFLPEVECEGGYGRQLCIQRLQQSQFSWKYTLGTPCWVMSGIEQTKSSR